MLLGKRTNVLLVKDDVGIAKPATRDIPAATFVYGKANKFDESAADSKLQKYSWHFFIDKFLHQTITQHFSSIVVDKY